MKKALWLPVILAGCFSLFPQQVTEESVVINIEVPVRVFEEGLFLVEKIYKYVALIGQLDNYNLVNEKKLLDFAEVLKYESGQKYVFIFYQKEFVPMIDPTILQDYMTRYNDRPDIMQTLTSLYDFYNRDVPFNIDIVKQAYADASENYYLLYYIPKNYKSDGKFRRIEVRVPTKDFRVIHRLGYFAE